MLKPAFMSACAAALFLAAQPVHAQTTETTEQTAAEAVDVDASTVVVTVDDTEITLGEIIAVRQSLPEQYQQLPDEVLMTALVQQLSDQQMLANAAEKGGLRSSITVQLALRNQERAVLADAYMADELVKRVDEAAVQAAYDAQFGSAEPVQEVRAAHILVEDEAAAKDLKAKIDEGADFAALAAEHGTDGTASRGGDLGWFSHEQMVPEFADAAFALETGAVSDPVQSPFGWHLIKLEEKRDQPVPPIDAVRDQLVGQLTEEAQRVLVEELRGSATIAKPEAKIPDAAVRNDALIVE
ncbi:MAG: peptidylprolyl isomerase [Pseudomonadota bacterium]